ncbi:MAG: prepilin-type N-terminal cleavage/methylation domain-containing protein [candidate division WWE3 bacterium]|nr:prepilin-type N-terminal cleavage/methylation domain-containing protein [candidate division WWE3 bacterium]
MAFCSLRFYTQLVIVMIINVTTLKLNHKFRNGFTLVELLVVIALIAILGVVAIAAINPSAKINSATDAKAMANVETLGKTMESCVADRLTAGQTKAQSITDCCGADGSTVPLQTCTSSGSLGSGIGVANYGYGYSSGFITLGLTINRSVAGGTGLCISQTQGTGTSPNNNTKYVLGGGTLVKNQPVCSLGS